MVIYQKLLPRTKKKGVFYLSLKICLLNRLASYDEYPPVKDLPGACLCSHSPMFPQPNVPTALCAHISKSFFKIRSYVPTALCSHISNIHYKIRPYVPTVPTFLPLPGSLGFTIPVAGDLKELASFATLTLLLAH